MKRQHFKLCTLLCQFTKGVGWRIAKIVPTLDSNIKVVTDSDEKYLSIPSSVDTRRGQFCNPAEIALDHVTGGRRCSVSSRYPLVVSHRSFTAFMNNYRAGLYGNLRLGLAFYHIFNLYDHEQSKLDNVWSKDSALALRAIKSFTRFIGDDEGTFDSQQGSIGYRSNVHSTVPCVRSSRIGDCHNRQRSV